MNTLNSSICFSRFSLAGMISVIFGISALPSFVHAELLDSWTQYSGSVSSGLNTASPVLGNGNADSESADSQTIYASSSMSYTLADVGDTVTLSAGVTFTGMVSPQSDQFRFGFYDVNGQPGATGWLGYYATNSGTSTGPTYSRLWERDNPNTGSFGSGAGASLLAWVNASPSNTAFESGTYSFSLSATRVESGLDLSWSMIGTGLIYSLSGTVVDTTPESYVFDRVGFFTGGGLNADQVAFLDVDLTFSAIPEPASTNFLLMIAAGLFTVGARHHKMFSDA
ncbi:hypothetical protein SH580_16890 [Coraliomargarita algicola]|uniref:PEP-CTERM protein-sorting domain-containing protein n=1 Tax=Coraliomargarita algicola TaxID=3092156 RepID=A0ABZ0RI04_9BACT|nr:hypothetical protein [Coraliomargarita sp. J2-16]WPJ95103.1 hypothetical protein SH580_16890 [Coraliomargarita sp. J2-16]